MKNKWVVYGFTAVVCVGAITPLQAFDFSPGRWMNPNQWFGGNHRSYGPPPPLRPPPPPQAYPLAYPRIAPTVYATPPVVAPAVAVPPVTVPRAGYTAIAPPAAITPPAPISIGVETSEPNPVEAPGNSMTFAPDTAESGLIWPDQRFVVDTLPDSEDLSFAPAGYLKGSAAK